MRYPAKFDSTNRKYIVNYINNTGNKCQYINDRGMYTELHNILCNANEIISIYEISFDELERRQVQ